MSKKVFEKRLESKEFKDIISCYYVLEGLNRLMMKHPEIKESVKEIFGGYEDDK